MILAYFEETSKYLVLMEKRYTRNFFWKEISFKGVHENACKGKEENLFSQIFQ